MRFVNLHISLIVFTSVFFTTMVLQLQPLKIFNSDSLCTFVPIGNCHVTFQGPFVVKDRGSNETLGKIEADF